MTIPRILLVLTGLLLVEGLWAQQPYNVRISGTEMMKQQVRQYSAGSTAMSRDSVGCGKNACMCEGARQCLNLIDSGKCDPDSFKCVGPPPLCICKRTTVSPLPLRSR